MISRRYVLECHGLNQGGLGGKRVSRSLNILPNPSLPAQATKGYGTLVSGTLLKGFCLASPFKSWVWA